ncbi:uncharacterized protein LOC113500978 [Trichoplusia ni]|uniref:Uncharacterized protein LOC113500978 n=1 Tax=Trichoplusia ni TaxID=7111 RepID=A0A7E5WAR2_TRINI|nr:uncharacterized protein LOC113500978 [Trichoplusia ni]
MDFQEMDAEIAPDAIGDQVVDELSDLDNSTPDESETQLVPSVDVPEPMANMNSGDGLGVQKIEPFATTSKSKHLTVASEAKKHSAIQGIQEFVRILRPHLPRKSKSKAYKMLQNIARGIIVSESSFQPRRRQKKPKRRPIRKPKYQLRKIKAKSTRGRRRTTRSLYESSESSESDTSCPRCGYSCCRISRF